jgi:dUTP pyrophosphatase
MIGVNVKNISNNPLPEYKTSGASGMDVRAFLQEPIIIKPGERKLVPTGLFFDLPENLEIQVRSRSGLAINSGIAVLNSPGTVDADYKGEVKVILINLGDKDFEINNGDRIAQLVFSEVNKVSLKEVELISSSPRDNNGFGSTGIK